VAADTIILISIPDRLYNMIIGGHDSIMIHYKYSFANKVVGQLSI
jgi:hypothetical protein